MSTKISIVFLPAKLYFVDWVYNDASGNQLGKLKEESNKIGEKLQTAAIGEQFDLPVEKVVSIDDLIGNLVKLNPQIVHFSGYAIRQRDKGLQNENKENEDLLSASLEKVFPISREIYKLCIFERLLFGKRGKKIARDVDCVIGSFPSRDLFRNRYKFCFQVFTELWILRGM